MIEMFKGCNELEYLILKNIDALNVDNMKSLFTGCCRLKEINGINGFNTSIIINMKEMFENCEELENLDLSNFDIIKMKNMGGMFRDYNKLKKIDGIEKFKTLEITDIGCMFYGCKELEKLDLSNFDTIKVTIMGGIFYECNKLKKINGIEKLKTPEVIDMEGMFYGCKELENLVILIQ